VVSSFFATIPLDEPRRQPVPYTTTTMPATEYDERVTRSTKCSFPPLISLVTSLLSFVSL
jgi:hypothetical protein